MEHKKKRNHSDQMAIRGEILGLYKIIILIQKEIKKLEIIINEDNKKEKENTIKDLENKITGKIYSN